jgi:hypothetical protein
MHYLQWFPSKENSVTASLSRDFWLGDEDVVKFFKQNVSHQRPQGFRLVWLSEAIITAIGSLLLLLLLLPKIQKLPSRPAPSETTAGGGISVYSTRSGITTTPAQ